MSSTLKGARPIALLAVGFTAWSVIFLVLYGMQAVGCRLAWDRIELFGSLSLQRLMQIGFYAAGIAWGTALYWWLRSMARMAEAHGTTNFLAHVSGLCALAAVAAVAITFVGTLWLTAC